MGVPGYTPVLIKHLGFVFLKTIQSLDGKDLTGMFTWTHAGWKPILGLKKSLSKSNIVEVKTNIGGLVHVTDDVCYEILHSFPYVDSGRYIKKISPNGQLKAQDKFIKTYRGTSGKISCIEKDPWECEKVFYDLETCTGTYQAGVGNIIVSCSI